MGPAYAVGRPDLGRLLREFVGGADPASRAAAGAAPDGARGARGALVSACGPAALGRACAAAAADHAGADFHAEAFEL